MSQNIFLVIRADIAAVSEQVAALQTVVEQVQSSLPDGDEINTKLDEQAAALTALQTTVNNINEILTPELPDVPVVPPVVRLPKNGKNKV
ncbi:p10 [Lambdina fiscellaria nucleopolyhedrovirus]|uniref:p10 n=1 Tax=Lambdina fiscellaria nucleopolyhedrovirus TaxID=1642929 RepID=A0A0E3URS6_9ABAC|nr:p10 [Lambdina fiscellaria nucleopolyhedrovirus]AKC91739.1 p10 [Lambdina fiscellaria nucleopolyhedrovirus]